MARQADSEQDSTASQVKKVENITHYPVTFLARALTFAQRFFAASAIAARPAADSTRFFTPFISLFVESPKALAAARTPVSLCCSLPN
jgi:hypothetical protein